MPGRDERSAALSPSAIGLLIFLALYVPIVVYLYGRQGRWYGAAGWSLLVAGVAGFGLGASRSFAWGGLFFGAVGAMGALLIVVDVAARARRH